MADDCFKAGMENPFTNMGRMSFENLWRTAKLINLIFYLYLLDLLSTCLLFVEFRFDGILCFIWIKKILLRSLLNVHAERICSARRLRLLL